MIPVLHKMKLEKNMMVKQNVEQKDVDEMETDSLEEDGKLLSRRKMGFYPLSRRREGDEHKRTVAACRRASHGGSISSVAP